MTDDLIARLSADLKPVRAGAMRRLLLAALGLGIVVAVAVMMMSRGMRPDMASAGGDPVFWGKFAYTLVLALCGGIATYALSRPDGRIVLPWLAAAAAILALAIAGLMQFQMAPTDTAMRLVTGSTAISCPWYIIALSVPVLAAILAAMRQFAPANPSLAGFAAGLLAGGTGAWVYSFSCDENGLAFTLIFYTLGVAAIAALGALLGRFVLRW